MLVILPGEKLPANADLEPCIKLTRKFHIPFILADAPGTPPILTDFPRSWFAMCES